MKIQRIRVRQKHLSLNQPYALSGGRLKFDSLDSTIVRIDTDTEINGLGEGCPWGHTYLPAFGEGLRAALNLLAPALLGQDPGDIDRLNRLMDRVLPGHGYAKSPLDIALWDIAGKRTDKPLYQLLGGRHGDHVDLVSSIATGSAEEMVSRIETARANGLRHHSAKIGGIDVGTDIGRINAI